MDSDKKITTWGQDARSPKRKGWSQHSLAQQFSRDYFLISFMPVVLILLAALVALFLFIDYSAASMDNTTMSLNATAEKSLRDLGEQMIHQTAVDVAKQLEIYLLDRPDATIKELQASEYFFDIAVQPVGETGYTAVYDSDGFTYFHIDQKIVGMDMHELSATLPNFWAIFEDSLDGAVASGYYEWEDVDGVIRKKYMVCVPVGDTHWRVAATTYIDEFSAAIVTMQDQSAIVAERYKRYARQQRLTAGSVGGSMLIVLFGTVWTLARRAARQYIQPIQQLSEEAKALGEGRQVRLPTWLLKREDEIGTLGHAFVQGAQRGAILVKELEQQATVKEKQREQLQKAAARMQDILTQVREAVSELDAAAAEILASTTQQASGANEQASAIAHTSATVDQVKIIAEQSVSRAEQVVDAAQHTVEVSKTGQLAVQATIDSMGRIETRVEVIAENILSLSEQTQQIGAIIDAVNEIAAQSNMLALNAAVEAARAGEHGKGFAVVAEKVRDLAERSKQATQKIKAILSNIQDATNTTVIATKEGTQNVNQGTRLAAQTQQTIAQLASVINKSAQAAMQMSAGGQQQKNGIDQVVVAMQSIKQITMQTLSSTRQTERSAQELNTLARNLAEIVDQHQT